MIDRTTTIALMAAILGANSVGTSTYCSGHYVILAERLFRTAEQSAAETERLKNPFADMEYNVGMGYKI